jgi:hypothetical protein
MKGNVIGKYSNNGKPLSIIELVDDAVYVSETKYNRKNGYSFSLGNDYIWLERISGKSNGRYGMRLSKDNAGLYLSVDNNGKSYIADLSINKDGTIRYSKNSGESVDFFTLKDKPTSSEVQTIIHDLFNEFFLNT